MIRILLLLPLIISCGRAQDSQLTGVENYAANVAVRDLKCGASGSISKNGIFNSRFDSLAPASRVIKFDASVPKREQDRLVPFIKSALTSVPKSLQDLFVFHNGVIRVTANLESQCQADKIHMMKENAISGKGRLDSCYSALFAKSKQVGALSIYLRNTPGSIGHGTLRAFGFLFADFFSHVQLSLSTGKSTFSENAIQSARLEFEGLHQIFKNDAKHVKSFENFSTGSVQSTFAESFDSLFCNNSEIVSKDNILRIKNEKINPSLIKSILSEEKNTEEIFKILFPDAHHFALGMMQKLVATASRFMSMQNNKLSPTLSLTSSAEKLDSDIFGNTSSLSSESVFTLPNQSSENRSSSSITGPTPPLPSNQETPFDLDSQPLDFQSIQFQELDSSFGSTTPNMNNSSVFNSPQPELPPQTQPQSSPFGSTPLADPDKQIIIYNNGGTINIGDPGSTLNQPPLIAGPGIQDPFNIPAVPSVPQYQTPEPQSQQLGQPFDSGNQNIQGYQSTPDSSGNQGDWISIQKELSDTVDKFVDFQNQKIQGDYQEQGWSNPNYGPPNSQIQIIQSYGGFYY